MGDGPGGAAAMKATAPFAFRYQYLAGGANTENGWATWNANGDFARFYIQDSIANGIIPVFTYYMLLQSLPGGGSESDAVFTNLNTTSTMTAYYNDVKLFFQKAGAFPSQKVVLHVEPDFWGYMQQRASADNAAGVPAKVSETGLPELAGLPAHCRRIRARDRQAAGHLRSKRGARLSHQRLGHRQRHRAVESARRRRSTRSRRARRLSTNRSPPVSTLRSPSSAIATPASISTCTATAAHTGGTPKTSAATPASWAGCPRRSRKRIVMWQIPLGNTKMRSQNNTWGHYQDNRTGVAARRGRADAPGGVSRRRSRRLPVRRRRRRYDLRVQRGERRHHQLRADQRQRHRLGGGDRRAGARHRRRHADAPRHARMPPTTTAGTSGGGRGGTTRTAPMLFAPADHRRRRRPIFASFGESVKFPVPSSQ